MPPLTDETVPLSVGDIVKHMLTGENVAHIVKDIHPGEDAWTRTICYAAYDLGLTRRSASPACVFCATGRPDPNQLSDAIVAEPNFAEAHRALAAAHSFESMSRKTKSAR